MDYGEPTDRSPVEGLQRTAARVVPGWLRGLPRQPLNRASRNDLWTDAGFVDDVDRAATAASAALLNELAALLSCDVEEQRTNPLSLFRSATVAITEVLQRWGVPPVHRDAFVAERFPDDVYGLAPAGWVDIDPELQSVGLAWGAWKAMTVLRRRRGDGQR